MTETGITIKIEYCTLEEYRPKGMEEFQQVLSENYITVIRAMRGSCGGGMNHLAVELISQIDLSDVLKIIRDGVIFDLMKSGSRAFVLQPFLNAYKKLCKLNAGVRAIGIEELNISFRDSKIKIYNLGETDVIDELEKIFVALAGNYENMILPSGEKPYEVYIPVFRDIREDGEIIYRQLQDYDETIQDVSKDDYYNYWGLGYDWDIFSRAYDLKAKQLLQERFFKPDWMRYYR